MSHNVNVLLRNILGDFRDYLHVVVRVVLYLHFVDPSLLIVPAQLKWKGLQAKVENVSYFAHWEAYTLQLCMPVEGHDPHQTLKAKGQGHVWSHFRSTRKLLFSELLPALTVSLSVRPTHCGLWSILGIHPPEYWLVGIRVLNWS